MTETEDSVARKKAEMAAKLKAQAAASKVQGKINPAMDDTAHTEFRGVRPPEAPALTKHSIQPGETLSDIAQKHYGHATREYWMLIYEANRVAIGDNPGMIKPGIELTIPDLPPALQGK